MDFLQVRYENNQQLSDKIERIRSAEELSVLESFARAYLGMFYEIDNSLSCDERVELLVSDKIAQAILEGFEVTVKNLDIATPKVIGAEVARGKELAQGYVVLAGMDRLAKQDRLSEVSQKTLRSAVCFTYSNNIPHSHSWLAASLRDPDVGIPALDIFWNVLMEKEAHLLPGLKKQLLEDKQPEFIARLSLPVLEAWQSCRIKIFKPLLQQALFFSDHEKMLLIARKKIDQEKLADENQRVFWITAAFLISPDIFDQVLAGYIGRLKQKVLPLLDFVMDTLGHQQSKEVISAKAIAQLLRIIAPIFPPQFHIYGTDKILDVNSQNVMFLFHKLSTYPEGEKAQALKILRKARVMKINKKVIDYCERLDSSLSDRTEFSQFLHHIIENGLVVEKSNRFDVR